MIDADFQINNGSATESRPGVMNSSTFRMLIAVVTLALVVGVGWWSLVTVERSKKAELSNALETTLAANLTALHLWFGDQKTLVSMLARDPQVQSTAAELTGRRGPSGEDLAAAALVGSPATSRLRALLDPIVHQSGFAGYAVVDRSSRVVAASEDRGIGSRALGERVDILGRVQGGEAAVSRPFPSEVPLTGVDGRATPVGTPTMLVAAPLRSPGGDVIGALILRVRPEAGFSKILQVARFGATGETYAVDRHGLMLSQSRFDDQIRPLGLINEGPSGRSMLGVEIRDPGGDMTLGFRPPTPRREQPLTRMASSVTAGNAATDVVGYNDYRGVPVVGAWRWLDGYGFGVTTEVDVAEAYQPLRLLRWTIGILLSLLLLSYGLTLFAARNLATMALKARWAERRVRQVESKVRQLGQYTLEEKLGEGGMGAVYRASHSMLRRPTAIKLLSAVKPNLRELLRFEREVQLTSRLNHPNTITIFDFGRTPEGLFYYAMEYLPGIDLDQLISQFDFLPEGRVIHIVGQIAAALQEAHAIGLIHRDIKPANLMLCERGGLSDFIKVLDFGLVREATSGDQNLTMAGSITGTPLYLAPEAIRNSGSADPRSDLYALGAVTFFLLTGRPVFPGTSAGEILSDHLHRAAPRPSEALGWRIDPDFESLIDDCLAKDPNRRPADAATFLDRLRRCAAYGTWTNDDARRWWDDHRDELKSCRLKNRPPDAPIPATQMTVAIALD